MKSGAITILDWGKVKFFLGEVLRNFTRNAGMQVTAIGTVTLTIVLLGAFLFLRSALTGIGTDYLSEIDISVYMKADATAAQSAGIRNVFAKDARVRNVQFVSKTQGLAELRDKLHGTIDTSLLTENPLPDKFRVTARDPQDVPALAAKAKTLAGVSDVKYPQELVARLLQLGGVLRRVGLGVIALFLVIAGVIISNTIRLTVFARRREISIMQLVGATNMYIRLPFICEGLLAGIVGSAIALGILSGAYVTLWPRFTAALQFVNMSAVHTDLPVLTLELLVAGGAIGIVASWISVGRHLRT